MKDEKLLVEGDVNFSVARTEWYAQLDEATRVELNRDSEVFLHQALSTPCLDVLESCEGIWLTDHAGKRYMDFHGNNVHQVGYRNPLVLQRVKAQLDVLPFSPRRFANSPAIELAERLTGLLPPGLSRILLAPGGTSAVSMALKLARVVTGKQKVVSFADSFHGASLDAIAAGGEEQFRRFMGPFSPDAIHIAQPVTYRNEYASDVAYADALEKAIVEDGQVGAFIAETIRNTDVQVPSVAYWQRVREICSRHKVLLILDEIPIAFGRTGKLFAFEHYGIVPDILCLGKGLGGGVIPIAAMVAREEYNIAAEVSLGHFTHEKSPLGSVAALAMLDFLEQEQLPEKVQRESSWVREELSLLKERHLLIGDVRGIGFLWGIELVRDRFSKEKATAEAEQVLYACLRDGLSFKLSQGNVLQLSPPLIITREQWREAIKIIDRALTNVVAGGMA